MRACTSHLYTTLSNYYSFSRYIGHNFGNNFRHFYRQLMTHYKLRYHIIYDSFTMLICFSGKSELYSSQNKSIKIFPVGSYCHLVSTVFGTWKITSCSTTTHVLFTGTNFTCHILCSLRPFRKLYSCALLYTNAQRHMCMALFCIVTKATELKIYIYNMISAGVPPNYKPIWMNFVASQHYVKILQNVWQNSNTFFLL